MHTAIAIVIISKHSGYNIRFRITLKSKIQHRGIDGAVLFACEEFPSVAITDKVDEMSAYFPDSVPQDFLRNHFHPANI